MADYALFLEPDETAFELFARVVVEPVYVGIPFLDQGALWLRPGHVVELSGQSGTAKSDLLVQAAATCVLPKHQHGVSYGGREGCWLFCDIRPGVCYTWSEASVYAAENTLFVDLDSKFDLLRLIQVLEYRVHAARQAQNWQGPASDQLLTECLERFHLVQCHSSFQFLALLKTLKPTLTALQNNGEMRLLLIDNIAAFFWLDKACRPLPTSANSAICASKYSSTRRCLWLYFLFIFQQALMFRQGGALMLQAVHTVVANELRLIMQHHKLAVLTTKHAVLSAPPPPAGGPLTYREFLPHSWHDLVTHRVMVRRAKGPLPNRRGQNSEQSSHHFEAQHLDSNLAATVYVARFAIVGGRLMM